ncbi:Rrf2 family transcriptional regulator [Paraburkholderia sp. IMGN_8]|uniref:RrF2 family transcriptional regulator n=1 Tax=Paraburkholderia sp. IMGN_8 TaxID=3136564 RepID=UPI003101313E
MARDNRLSRILHVLIHFDQCDRGMTSDEIGTMLGTNPVVVRRTMAGLRDRGYVSSEKGHGGGWTLARPLEQLTLLDIYEAIGEPAMFAMGLAEEHQQCLVVGAVNNTLNDTLNEARELILKRFEGVTLADISADVETRLNAHESTSKIGSRKK